MIKKKCLFWEYDIPKTVKGSLKIAEAGWINDEHLTQFLKCAHRYKGDFNKYAFIRGLKAALLAIGYDEEWVNAVFYNKAIKMY